MVLFAYDNFLGEITITGWGSDTTVGYRSHQLRWNDNLVCLVNQSINKLVSQLVSQSISQSASQLVSQSMSQSINQLVRHWLEKLSAGRGWLKINKKLG